MMEYHKSDLLTIYIHQKSNDKVQKKYDFIGNVEKEYS